MHATKRRADCRRRDAQEARACSKAFGAEARHSCSSCARRERAVGVAMSDDVLGQRRRRRRRRAASSGAEAVFTSTPTALTQSSTTRVERARAASIRTVVLILADADRLRVDLHQFGQRVLQAARDRDRAAQGHVEVGQFRAAHRPRRNRPTRPLRDTTILVSFSSGAWPISSAASLSVSREAVPLPMAISSTLCWTAEAAERRERLRPSAAAARADRSSPSRRPCRWRRPPRPSRRCESRDRGRAWRACRRARRAADRADCGRRP